MNLIFFDIDGTLLLSQGAGGKSITRVMKSAFSVSEPIARIEIHGQTDRGIATQLFDAHGIDDSEENWQLFISSYLKILPDELESSQGSLLPGIPDLLPRLEEHHKTELALLTGNIEAGAIRKVTHFGIDQYFSWGGFGDRQRDRCDLAREAMQTAKTQLDLSAINNIFVIGDTPNDIRCGKAIDAKTIAVATAGYSREQLLQHDPDFLMNDLSKTDEVVDLLTQN